MIRNLAQVLLVAASLALVMHRSNAQSTAAASDATAGRPIFSSTCAACHGLDGRGGEHAPNIATDPRIQATPDSALRQIIRKGIPAAGMPGFEKTLSDPQQSAVLAYLRLLQGGGNTGPLTGDAKRGRELFYGKAGCAECHTVDGRGGFLGADLTGYGKQHPAAAVREAIIEPNKNIDERRGAVSVVTRSGKELRGIVRNEDNFSLQLQTVDGSFHLLDKSDLARIEREPRSLMPADYGTKLTGSELDDLISFLSQAGSRVKVDDDDDDQ
jgi:cytochrome c oxidase cbb3-type subunit III